MSDEIRAKRLAKLSRPVEISGPDVLLSNDAPDRLPIVSLVVNWTDEGRHVVTDEVNRSLGSGLGLNTESEQPSSSSLVAPSALKRRTPPLSDPLSLEVEMASFLTDHLAPLFGASLFPQGDLVFLLSLSAELSGVNRVGPSHIEDIYMEILTERGYPPQINNPIAYCFLVYTAALRARRSLPIKTPFYSAKCEFLSQIAQLSVSYALIPFQVPSMFVGGDNDESVALLCNSFSEMSPFFTDMLVDSARKEISLEFLDEFLNCLSRWDCAAHVDTLLAIYESIVSVKGVVSVFTSTCNFFPIDRALGLKYQTSTFLGLILSISPLTNSTSYFPPGSWDVGSGQLATLYESTYTEHTVQVDRLFFIVDKLIRALPQSRHDMLTWLAGLVNASHLRRGSHADPATLPSDGFMYNLTIIMIKLSLPFMDFPGYTKISKIDLQYLQKNSMVDTSEEPRANSTIQDAVAHASVEEDVNFISHCFFITSAYVHYGMGGIYLTYDRLKQGIDQATQQMESIKQTLESNAETNPAVNTWLRLRVPALSDQLNLLHAQRHVIKALFSCTRTQHEIFDFLIGTATYICRVIDPAHMYPHAPLKVPLTVILDVALLDDQDYLRSQAPVPWRYMPEFVIEGLVNYAKFSVRFTGCPLIRNENKLDRLIEMFVVLLRCPELLGNPHLKAAIVEVLFVGAQPLNNGQAGFAMSAFTYNQIVRENLLYALLDFYVMVEKTGALLQFYDKFNSRYYASVIIEELWKVPQFRAQLLAYSRNNVAFFVRFVARMLNDTTYLLDETFNELNAIHDMEVESRSRAQGKEPNAEMGTDAELAKNLQSSERKASSYVSLSNKTMELFQLFTKELPQAFVLPEISDRLAGMLDYNLGVLVGPKCSGLKVADPAKYKFAPKKMLGDLCSVFVNLAGQDEFVAAVARDGRSFNKDYFEKAQRILSERTQHSMQSIDALMDFCRKAQDRLAQDQQEESELGEVPDEFLDPLMYTLMEDPVILPGLKISIDRLTIKAHLLSDASDPFNRMPLRLEQVVDDVDLRAKIVAFKAEQRRRRLAGDVAMD